MLTAEISRDEQRPNEATRLYILYCTALYVYLFIANNLQLRWSPCLLIMTTKWL